MRKGFIYSSAASILFAVFTLAITGDVSAQENNDLFRCPEHPPAQWNRSEVLVAKLNKAGYKVEKISATAGGCYEVFGRNPNNQPIRLQIDPLSLRALKTDPVITP